MGEALGFFVVYSICWTKSRAIFVWKSETAAEQKTQRQINVKEATRWDKVIKRFETQPNDLFACLDPTNEPMQPTYNVQSWS